MCVSVYGLDDDRVGRQRPSAGCIVHTDNIIIVSEDEQCRKGGDMPERRVIVQELCESRGGRSGLSVLTSLLVSVDVKIY